MLKLDLLHSSYRRIVKIFKFKPYIHRLIHGLLEDDPDRRLKYCEVMLSQIRENPTLFCNILFSDEAQFKLNGLINRHHSVYYENVNSHITYEQQLNQPSLTVWVGFSTEGVFGAYFLESTLHDESCLHML